MLTARCQEIDKVRGLELGADDYMTKPFGVKELLARIRAVLRRAGEMLGRATAGETVIGSAQVSFAHGRIRRGKKDFPLGYYEGEILKMLLEKESQVVDRQEMLRQIWNLENEPMNRSVDNHIVSLRRKIEGDAAAPHHILTVHGFGYKLVR
jgi:DNA-binding response OmpR family regulator